MRLNLAPRGRGASENCLGHDHYHAEPRVAGDGDCPDGGGGHRPRPDASRPLAQGTGDLGGARARLGGHNCIHASNLIDRLSPTPAEFRAALLEELRAAWGLDAPTLTDVYRLLLVLVKPRHERSWRTNRRSHAPAEH